MLIDDRRLLLLQASRDAYVAGDDERRRVIDAELDALPDDVGADAVVA